MNSYPREPSPGDKISAQLIRDIIRCLRRITPLAGPGVKANVTPNGTHLTATPADGVAPAATPPGCWNIITETYEDEEPRKKFDNMYYQIGGSLRLHGEDVYLDEFILKGELLSGEEYTPNDLPFIVLKVNMTPESFGELIVFGYKNFEEMQEHSHEPNLFFKPLYQLTHFGGIKVDFRNMPLVSSAENPDSQDEGSES